MALSKQHYNPALNGKYRWLFAAGMLFISGSVIFGKFYEGPYEDAIAITISVIGLVLLFAFMLISIKEKRSRV